MALQCGSGQYDSRWDDGAQRAMFERALKVAQQQYAAQNLARTILRIMSIPPPDGLEEAIAALDYDLDSGRTGVSGTDSGT